MIDLFGADRAGSTARADDRSARPASVRRRLRAYRSARREQRGDRPPPRVAVPSFFTLMNLLCGFMALTQVADAAFVLACWLIVLAGFFDLLDGVMARLTGADSPFGVQLDSLSDIVSFGVAPSFLLYGYVLDTFNPLGMIVAALPALCGAVRLARYNMTADESDKEGFEGLPIPGQAIAVVALILAAENSAWDGRFALDSLRVVLPVVIVLSGLMVSSIRFDAIPMPSLEAVRTHPSKIAAYGLAGLLIVGLQERGLLIVLTAYLLHGVGRALYKLVRALVAPLPDERLGS
ncbi:CDP-diacylglycerol--serine O-phosphatidyltransferase [Salinibacter ruber]|uniref:CDP-diacylglycerol--serine O-phosphatidyltransferase n=1 Tax=Salinibacter ruber TaxID=146919 RepID=A0A9X2ZYY8_9BACT|nr:CDP-diacylglycerol--serine O-phosphatidyltransferase [Salinibacter ruber]MCS3612305.1 CDP-diacylglycerol--serine O-phosphatidyltransferase [Salinibacter ruber]MCS3615794.1 CDP-diacylglycerol--serine O-phosphatidyltransferase [Salinibacter ruber]MCS3647456.1 CDP-diacylglycerol--serine O-phosphatidyltransferase [Salinibacter ruber]MCS3674424.1 CDP-diacylglycerol--serine O-phosphatidyltransferase [Salinibacter ruber]MCS3784315.1 CDP-diacylglycerol--serine O-phosphatidyltransferase [Salinibacte